MVDLSLVFSATVSEWDDGNIDLPEPFEFETVKDIMSYLENNYWKDTNYAAATSKPLDEFNQVFHLFTCKIGIHIFNNFNFVLVSRHYVFLS